MVDNQTRITELLRKLEAATCGGEDLDREVRDVLGRCGWDVSRAEKHAVTYSIEDAKTLLAGNHNTRIDLSMIEDTPKGALDACSTIVAFASQHI